MTEKSPKSRTEEKKVEIQKKPKGSGFWITLIGFSSIWMFIFGVFVGRGSVPVQVDLQKLQNELMALKENVLRKEKEKLDAHSRGIKESAGLDFFDELKQADGFRAAQTTPPAPAVPSVSPPDPKTTARAKEKPEPSAAKTPWILPNKVQVQAKPNEKQPPENRPETVEKPSGMRWAIQVASMKDEAAANKMVEQLKQKGYPAYRFGANVPGKGVWHRIRVGPYKDKTDAEKKLIRLKNDNFSAMLVSP